MSLIEAAQQFITHELGENTLARIEEDGQNWQFLTNLCEIPYDDDYHHKLSCLTGRSDSYVWQTMLSREQCSPHIANVAEHTLHVSRELDTSHMTRRQAWVSRLAALGHDSGKAFGAYEDHPAISEVVASRMLRNVFSPEGPDLDLETDVRFAIRHHHLIGLLTKANEKMPNLGLSSSLYRIIPTFDAAMAVCAVGLADIASIPDLRCYLPAARREAQKVLCLTGKYFGQDRHLPFDTVDSHRYVL